MAKYFNVNGACRPGIHYMVNLEPKLKEIRTMIENGQYFTINRARQHGKTTTLRALADYLKTDYTVISLDFQRMSSLDFENESAFVNALAREISRRIQRMGDVPDDTKMKLLELAAGGTPHKTRLAEIFDCFCDWCGCSPKPIVLLIDEADTATNNQVFLDFLAQLRAAYLDNDVTPTFQSVILASVYDIRNIRGKHETKAALRTNSPWNIAASFRVDMGFSSGEIAGMLEEYEQDHLTGMDIQELAEAIYNRTSGYPYLVSGLCKYLDEEICGTADFPDRKQAWTKDGVIEAEKLLTTENNPLFQSLTGKLTDYPQLRSVIYELLFTGKPIPYVPQNPYIDVAAMIGFIRNDNGTAVISNRIFESVLYNLFISEEFSESIPRRTIHHRAKGVER